MPAPLSSLSVFSEGLQPCLQLRLLFFHNEIKGLAEILEGQNREMATAGEREREPVEAPQTGKSKSKRDAHNDTTVKWLCMNLHFFRGLVSAMNIILGHYNLIFLLELMV